MVRSPYVDINGLKRGAWSEEEDDKLRAYIQRYGNKNWRQLPKLAGLSRCGKSCRLRWLNYLRPGVKRGNYSVEEEDLIIKLQEQFGNSWSAIAARLPGRTDNDIKNYWHTRLEKRMKQDSKSSKNMEQSSDQHEQSSELSSFDPKQKREPMEPEIAAAASGNAYREMSSLSCDSTLFDGIDKFEEDSKSSVASFTETFESFWTQPFALDTSCNDNNHWLPPMEEEFMNPFSHFLDDDMNWFHESESLF